MVPPQHFIPVPEAATAEKSLKILRTLQVPEPLRDARDALAAYFEHGLAPGVESTAAYDAWTLEKDHLRRRLRESFKALPQGAIKEHLAPLFPGLAQQVAASDPKLVAGELYRRTLEHILEKVPASEADLASNAFGTETLGLLRALVGGVANNRRQEVLGLLATARSSLQAIPRYDADEEALGDNVGNDFQAVTNAVRTFVSVYEKRGVPVIELMWGLAHLNGWCKPEPPKDAHEKLATIILPKNLPAYSLGEFDYNWRHWRNSAYHNLLEIVFDNGDWAAKIVDKKTKNGPVTYDKTVDGRSVFLALAKAWALLHTSGSYPSAIEILHDEMVFDSLNEAFLAEVIDSLIAHIR